MTFLPLWSTLFLACIGPIASQTGSSFFYYYSPNQPMQINSQTFGSNAQSHHQLLPANENSNPFNLQNHFRGNSNSNSPQGGTGGGGFHREVTPIPYVTTSPFIPRRQPHGIQNNQNQHYQQQPQQNYESSLLDKITFANAPPTQPSPPELNSYYNQQQQSGISTPPTTSFPGQAQPSAKLFNFLNQPFQFFQNSYNRFAQNNQQQQQQQQQQSNDGQTPPRHQQRQPIIPQEVPNSHIPQQINEGNQQYFYNYYSRPNQQGASYHQGTASNKEPEAPEQRYVSQSPGVDYNVPPPAVKDRSRQQSFLVNQYFSTKTTQGPPTSYTFTIGADPTSGPTATVRVNVGGPGDELPPPPKLSFPNHQRLIPIRQYEPPVISEEEALLPEAPETNQEQNQVNSQLAPESPPVAYPPQESQPEAPPQSPVEMIDESDDYEEAEPLTTTGKPVIMVITNRRTTTEDSQTIITTASTTTTSKPTSTSTTAAPTEPSTTTTATPALSSTTTMTTTTEMPSPSTTTTTTTQAPPTTTASTTTTTSTTTTPKPPAIKQRKVIRKKVARKRLPPRGKNSLLVTPQPPPTPPVEEEVQEEYRIPGPPRPEEEQVEERLEEISPITTQSPGRRRTTTSERPFRITTRKLRLRITTTPVTTTTTTTSTSTTEAPEELEVATTTAAAPPPREVYTTSPPRRVYTTTQSPRRVNYSSAPPTNAPEEEVEEVEGATIAPVFRTTTEEIIPRTFNSRQPEPEFTSSTGKSVASEEEEEDSGPSSSSTTTEPSRIYNEVTRSRSRTTEAPFFIEGDIDDDAVAVGTTASTLEGTTASSTSTESAIIYTTSRSRSTSTFSPSEGSSTESTTGSHSNGQSNASPDVNYLEYDEYYEYDETPGHTEASSTSSPTTTSSSTSTTPSTTEAYRGRGEIRQRATTTSPETFPTTVFSRTRSSTTSDESLIEDDEYVRTGSPVSSATTSAYRNEADSSGVPSSTEATTEPIFLSEDEIIEPLSTTEAPVSSSTQSDVSTEESADDLNGINSSSSSTTVSPTLASTTDKSESTTVRESELVSSTEEGSSRSGKAIESQVSQDPLSEEAPAVVDYKDAGFIGEAGGRDFYETPVRELDEVSPTGPSSTSEAPVQLNYDDFPDQEEYNYPEEREEFDPYEDEKIEEAKKLSLKAALQNIRSRQNATSTTEKPLNETSTEKKFLRKEVRVRTFSSGSSASSSTGNTYDDEELGEDSRSQVIQKIQSFRQKLRKVTTTVVRASTTKRPRRVTRPSNKSTSTENPGDLSQNENDIRGNGKDELDNEVSRHPKVISGKKKNAEEFKEEEEKKEMEISSDAVVSLPGGQEEKSLGSVKDTIRNDGNDDSQNEPKPNQLEFEEVSSSTTTASTTTTTTSTSTSSPVSSDEPSSTVKNAVTHVGELIIHEILPTTSTTSTTEETPQDQKELDFDTGSVETGQHFEHSTSISVAISSEFEDEDEPSSSTTTVAPTTTTTTSTTTALPITTKRPKGRFVRVRGKQVNVATTTAATSTTTAATPIITTAPTTTEAATTAAASSTELSTSSSSTTEESLPSLVATEISFQTNFSNLETSSESSSSSVGSGRKVKVILKRRKGAPKGGKATVTRQVVRTRSRSKPKVTDAA